MNVLNKCNSNLPRLYLVYKADMYLCTLRYDGDLFSGVHEQLQQISQISEDVLGVQTPISAQGWWVE